MSDTLQANAPEARSPTGEILNQAPIPEATQTTPATPTQPPTEPAKAAGQPESLVNQAVPGGAPEKYEFKGNALPEATLTAATALFKGMNLSQDQAQQLVDFHAAQAAQMAEASNEAAAAIRTSWQAQVKADPELGPRLPAVRQAISSALDVLGDPKLAGEFRKAMDFTGAGDNPAFVKALYKLSQMVIEPRKHVAGTGPSPAGQRAPGAAPPTPAKALYPNLS